MQRTFFHLGIYLPLSMLRSFLKIVSAARKGWTITWMAANGRLRVLVKLAEPFKKFGVASVLEVKIGPSKYAHRFQRHTNVISNFLEAVPCMLLSCDSYSSSATALTATQGANYIISFEDNLRGTQCHVMPGSYLSGNTARRHHTRSRVRCSFLPILRRSKVKSILMWDEDKQ